MNMDIDVLLRQETPHSSIASGCVTGASKVVLQKFGQINMVCTLVQVIYVRMSNIAHSDALLH